MSIIFILITHSYFIKEFEPIRNYFDFGHGVDLFFVISGYLMGATYISKLDLNYFEFSKAYNFYVKRICRLLPAVIFWNLVLLCLTYVWKKLEIFHSASDVYRDVVSNISFVGNFFNASYENGFGYWWSLGLEVQFYLLLPVFLYLFKSKFWKFIISVVIGSCLFDLFMQFPKFWMFRFHGLFIGLILWKVSTKEEFGQIKTVLNRLSPLKIHAFLLFFLLSALMLTKSINGYQFSTHLFTGIMLGLAMFIAITFDNVLFFKGFSNFLIFIGKISFSLYVSHMLVFFTGDYLFRRFELWNMAGIGYTLLIISLIVAYLSYKYIEPLAKKENYLIQ